MRRLENLTDLSVDKRKRSQDTYSSDLMPAMTEHSSHCDNVENSFPPNMNESLDSDEYTTLDRYVSSLRDARRLSTTGEGDGGLPQNNRIPWWAPWRHMSRILSKKKHGSEHSDGDKTFLVPGAWLKTNIHDGLSENDVDWRRNKIGWNELTTQRENMFLKFLSYFRGPILYGLRYPDSVLNNKTSTDA